MAICNHCGAEIPAGSAFCPKCGAKVESQPGTGNDYSKAGTGASGSGFSAPAGGGHAPIQSRNIGICILLSIITCGIYSLVWFYNLVSDLNTACPAPDDMPAGTVLLLDIITCGIYGAVWFYKAGEKVDRLKTFNGEPPSHSAVLYLVLSLVSVSIIASSLLQNELNKMATIPA